MNSKGFDEYGYYGENNPPLPSTDKIREMTEEERKASIEREKANSVVSKAMTNSTWHYQLMRHKNTMSGREYYAIHEYYQMEDGDEWSGAACYVDGDSVEDVKWVLQAMLEDIEKHGVKDYE